MPDPSSQPPHPLDFSQSEHARYQYLAKKAQRGTLTPQEHIEINRFLDRNDLLAIIEAHAKTLRSTPNPHTR